MKRFLYTIMGLLFIISCQNNSSEQVIVEGNIKGLKKGRLYLQKLEDTVLIAMDSLKIDGDSKFTFTTELESPEMLYLYLNKKDGNELNDRISFFVEPGNNVQINTSRELFEVDAKVSGSSTHELYEIYKKGKSRYNNTHLDLLKAQLESRIDSNQTVFDSLGVKMERNMVRSYLYTINYALNNKDSFIAPYLVLSDAYDAQTKYLDTINNALNPEVASSKYGIMLQEFIDKIKLKESN